MSLVSGSHPYDKDAVEQWFSEFLTAKENPDFYIQKLLKELAPLFNVYSNILDIYWSHRTLFSN